MAIKKIGSVLTAASNPYLQHIPGLSRTVAAACKPVCEVLGIDFFQRLRQVKHQPSW